MLPSSCLNIATKLQECVVEFVSRIGIGSLRKKSAGEVTAFC